MEDEFGEVPLCLLVATCRRRAIDPALGEDCSDDLSGGATRRHCAINLLGELQNEPAGTDPSMLTHHGGKAALSADGALDRLAGDAGAAVAAQLTVLRRAGIVAVQIRGCEVLQQVKLDEHVSPLL